MRSARRRRDEADERGRLLHVAPALARRRDLDPAMDAIGAFLDRRQVDDLAGRTGREPEVEAEFVEEPIGERPAAPGDLVDRLGDQPAMPVVDGRRELLLRDGDLPAGLDLWPRRQN